MPYSVEEIIEASNKGQRLVSPPIPKIFRFSLRTAKSVSLNQSNAEDIKKLVKLIEKKCDVKIECVGGGAGCADFEFAIEVKSGKSACDVIKNLISDPELIEGLKKGKIRVIVDENSGETYSVDELPDPNSGSSVSNITKGENSGSSNPEYDRFGNKRTGTDDE